MSWNSALTYTVTPKSGPVRQLKTLDDARSALINDVPSELRKTPHWLEAGRLLVSAGETGTAAEIAVATEALVHALDTEGWLSRSR